MRFNYGEGKIVVDFVVAAVIEIPIAVMVKRQYVAVSLEP